MRHAIPAAALAAAALSCARLSPSPADAAPAAARFRPEDAPPTLAPAVARADEAIRALRERLSRRLSEELAASGAAGALPACATEAPAIAAAVREETGVDVGRTSRRLRDPANAPRPWVKALLADAHGKPPASVAATAVDLGDRVGVARPIVVADACLSCHGAPGTLSPGVQAWLDARFPQDAATGYEPGDFRGFFWAEARK